CPEPSVTVTTSVYVPSATPRESHIARAVHVSGSLVRAEPVAVPTGVVAASAETSVQVAVPAPSPVRTSTLSAIDPLKVPAPGALVMSTGMEVAAIHVAVAACVFDVSGPVDSTGTTL